MTFLTLFCRVCVFFEGRLKAEGPPIHLLVHACLDPLTVPWPIQSNILSFELVTKSLEMFLRFTYFSFPSPASYIGEHKAPRTERLTSQLSEWLANLAANYWLACVWKSSLVCWLADCWLTGWQLLLFKQSCICWALCSNTHTFNDFKCVLKKKEALLFGCKMEVGEGLEGVLIRRVCVLGCVWMGRGFFFFFSIGAFFFSWAD